MEHNFPPQKAVIGINYLTGANSADSHNLPVSIEFTLEDVSVRRERASENEHVFGVHARENRSRKQSER